MEFNCLIVRDVLMTFKSYLFISYFLQFFNLHTQANLKFELEISNIVRRNDVAKIQNIYENNKRLARN